jgi:hypothetical protein
MPLLVVGLVALPDSVSFLIGWTLCSWSGFSRGSG